MNDLDALLRSPTFQLNLVIWLCMDLPHDHPSLRPVLARRGFCLRSLSPPLALPPQIRDRLVSLAVRCNSRVSPDLVVAKAETGQVALVECKANSHGPESHAAHQTRALLLAAGHARDVLDEPSLAARDCAACYVVPLAARGPMLETLGELAHELGNAGFDPGQFHSLGLSCDSEGVLLEACPSAARYFSLPGGPERVLVVGDGNDPRPLYMVPYDPDVDDKDEKEYGVSVLKERLHQALLGAIGPAAAPATIRLSAEELLNQAMLGTYAHWENAKARSHLRSICSSFIRTLGKEIATRMSGVFQEDRQQVWVLAIESEEVHQEVLAIVARFKASTMRVEDESSSQLEFNYEDDE